MPFATRWGSEGDEDTGGRAAILLALAGIAHAGEIRLIGDPTPEACYTVRGVLAGELKFFGQLELGDWHVADEIDFEVNYYREWAYGPELGLDQWDLKAISDAATNELLLLNFSQCLVDSYASISERVIDGKAWHEAPLVDSRGNTISVTTAEIIPGTIAVQLSLVSKNPPL